MVLQYGILLPACDVVVVTLIAQLVSTVLVGGQVEINETGTMLRYKPGVIIGAC